MNIRSVYVFLIIALSLGLLFEWSSDKKNQSIERHLEDVESPSFIAGDDYIVLENEELYVVVAVETGAIVETRLKKYLVEDVEGSVGYRVFGRSDDSTFNYYFRSGDTGANPSYVVFDNGPGFVELYDESLGVSKKISFCI